LPFQLASGSHTSNSMSLSLLGRMLPATRQKSGRPVIGRVLPGGVKLPPVTVCATLITVFGSAILARLAQSVAASAAGALSAVVLSSKAAELNLVTALMFRVSSEVLHATVVRSAERQAASHRKLERLLYEN
jgi:hypothetical protein